jgi:hypothetical protein
MKQHLIVNAYVIIPPYSDYLLKLCVGERVRVHLGFWRESCSCYLHRASSNAFRYTRLRLVAARSLCLPVLCLSGN